MPPFLVQLASPSPLVLKSPTSSGRSLGGRVSFSASELSSGESAPSTPAVPQGPSRRHRRRCHRRRIAPSGFLGAAPGAGRGPAPVPKQAPSAARVAHLPRLSTLPDADGFRLVQSRRRWRRRATPRQSRPVPPNLVGLCFNCLASNHVKTVCRFPTRCFRCRCEGHRAHDCGRRMAVGAQNCGRFPPRPVQPRRGASRRRAAVLHNDVAAEDAQGWHARVGGQGTAAIGGKRGRSTPRVVGRRRGKLHRRAAVPPQRSGRGRFMSAARCGA